MRLLNNVVRRQFLEHAEKLQNMQGGTKLIRGGLGTSNSQIYHSANFVMLEERKNKQKARKVRKFKRSLSIAN